MPNGLKPEYLYPNTPQSDNMLSDSFEMITASDIRAKRVSCFNEQELAEIEFENPYKVVSRLCLRCGQPQLNFWKEYCNCDEHIPTECHHMLTIYEIRAYNHKYKKKYPER